jgi:hypothetical protein
MRLIAIVAILGIAYIVYHYSGDTNGNAGLQSGSFQGFGR